MLFCQTISITNKAPNWECVKSILVYLSEWCIYDGYAGGEKSSTVSTSNSMQFYAILYCLLLRARVLVATELRCIFSHNSLFFS
jgi:hypothetical protein